MKDKSEIKREVQEFYDQYGWKQIGEGLYQNSRYEDLRPVSEEYVQRCRERVKRYLPERGRLILDGGSGPIQYGEYEEYSRGFAHRVCLDISRLALMEARKRIGDHGLFVVGDLANLPFKPEAFDAAVSMHVIYHLPMEDQESAFREFFRVLSPGGEAVVIYSWGEHSKLMCLARLPIKMGGWLLRQYSQLRFGKDRPLKMGDKEIDNETRELLTRPGLYSFKHDYNWLQERVGDLPRFEVRAWRTVSSAFLRALVHRQFFGRYWLRLLYRLEERFPRFLGRWGQYPMVLFEKPDGNSQKAKRG
ncbi:MAG: class I SAM-dependent methyltransferase [Anaerolineales bacterium]|nr:class I SAM-dependent methyltransferase [Anaerolineales bacterium]